MIKTIIFQPGMVTDTVKCYTRAVLANFAVFMKEAQYAVIVLGAGRATRMGHAKQLLKYQGKTLLARAIELALKISDQVLVVLGAYLEETKPEAKKYPVSIVINHQYREGIGSSIHAGVLVAGEIAPDIDGVLVTLIDQPEITVEHLSQLALGGSAASSIVATSYGGVVGVPAYFPRRFLDELGKLSGDTGAKDLLTRYKSEVIAIPCDAAANDIDTEKDWRDFIHPDRSS